MRSLLQPLLGSPSAQVQVARASSAVAAAKSAISRTVRGQRGRQASQNPAVRQKAARETNSHRYVLDECEAYLDDALLAAGQFMGGLYMGPRASSL